MTAAARIGLVSDTHGRVPAALHELLAGCDVILHAGDVGPEEVLIELETIAPVKAVLGNCDRGLAAWRSPLVRLEVVAEVRFLVLHILEGEPRQVLGAAAEAIASHEPHVVVHGHTHVARLEQSSGVLFVNPGSAGSPRRGHPITCATIDAGDPLVLRFVEIETRRVTAVHTYARPSRTQKEIESP